MSQLHDVCCRSPMGKDRCTRLLMKYLIAENMLCVVTNSIWIFSYQSLKVDINMILYNIMLIPLKRLYTYVYRFVFASWHFLLSSCVCHLLIKFMVMMIFVYLCLLAELLKDWIHFHEILRGRSLEQQTTNKILELT